eukprot:COSAG01_NODE_105_length_26080_cov_7.640237_9_plen_2696_part_00
MDLSDFLAAANLAQYGAAFTSLGCMDTLDLGGLEDDQCTGVGMKPVEIKRMQRKLGEFKKQQQPEGNSTGPVRSSHRGGQTTLGGRTEAAGKGRQAVTPAPAPTPAPLPAQAREVAPRTTTGSWQVASIDSTDIEGLQNQLKMLGAQKRQLREAKTSCVEIDAQMQAIMAKIQQSKGVQMHPSGLAPAPSPSPVKESDEEMARRLQEEFDAAALDEAEPGKFKAEPEPEIEDGVMLGVPPASASQHPQPEPEYDVQHTLGEPEPESKAEPEPEIEGGVMLGVPPASASQHSRILERQPPKLGSPQPTRSQVAIDKFCIDPFQHAEFRRYEESNYLQRVLGRLQTEYDQVGPDEQMLLWQRCMDALALNFDGTCTPHNDPEKEAKRLRALRLMASLSDADSKAMLLWTMDKRLKLPEVFNDVNKALLCDDPERLEKFGYFIAGLNCYIANHPVEEAITLLRGTKIKVGQRVEVEEEAGDMGRVFRQPLFCAASPDEDVIAEFSSDSSPVMEFRVPAGCTRCARVPSNLSTYPEESEYLLSPYAPLRWVRQEERVLGGHSRLIVTFEVLDSSAEAQLEQCGCEVRSCLIMCKPIKSLTRTFRGSSTSRAVGDTIYARALVIGIKDYVRDPLRNTVHDASDLGARLELLGFDVKLITDDTQTGMVTVNLLDEAVAKFVQSVDQNTVAVFAFMGHGAELSGDHYLVPQDFGGEAKRLAREALNQQQVLRDIEAKQPLLTLAILDCCREKVKGQRGLFSAGGLAAVQAPVGTHVLYATGEGQMAHDGDGRNGVFTETLLQHIGEPGLTLNALAIRVAKEVKDKTSGKQVPEQLNRTTCEVCLVATPTVEERVRKSMDERMAELDASQAQTRAQSIEWVRLKGPADPLEVCSEASTLIATVPCSLSFVSIFGAARGGKSTLMSFLAGIPNVFEANPGSISYTKGINISSKILSLQDFSSVRGEATIEPTDGPVRVAFADAEGQGDMGNQYDIKLVAGTLVVSRVILFNWAGTFQKNEILDKLAVMTEVAKKLRDPKGSEKPFGHLHVVFQNCRRSVMADGPKALFSMLMSPEADDGFDSAVAGRNQIRKMLLASFESVRCQLMPRPVDDDEKYEISAQKPLQFEDLTAEYRDSLEQFRASIAKQLQVPRTLGGATLNGGSLAGLMEEMATKMTADGHLDSFVPASVYEDMREKQRVEEERLAKEAEIAALKQAQIAAAKEAARLQQQMKTEREQAEADVAAAKAEAEEKMAQRDPEFYVKREAQRVEEESARLHQEEIAAQIALAEAEVAQKMAAEEAAKLDTKSAQKAKTDMEAAAKQAAEEKAVALSEARCFTLGTMVKLADSALMRKKYPVAEQMGKVIGYDEGREVNQQHARVLFLGGVGSFAVDSLVEIRSEELLAAEQEARATMSQALSSVADIKAVAIEGHPTDGCNGIYTRVAADPSVAPSESTYTVSIIKGLPGGFGMVLTDFVPANIVVVSSFTNAAGTAASAAGMQRGSCIIEVNCVPVTSKQQISAVLGQALAGSEVQFKLVKPMCMTPHFEKRAPEVHLFYHPASKAWCIGDCFAASNTLDYFAPKRSFHLSPTGRLPNRNCLWHNGHGRQVAEGGPTINTRWTDIQLTVTVVTTSDYSELFMARLAANIRPIWVPDDGRTQCMLCSTAFETGMFGLRIKGRHHCRYCGWLVCDKCTPKNSQISTDRWVSSTSGHELKFAAKSTRETKQVCTQCAELAPTLIMLREQRQAPLTSWSIEHAWCVEQQQAALAEAARQKEAAAKVAEERRGIQTNIERLQTAIVLANEVEMQAVNQRKLAEVVLRFVQTSELCLVEARERLAQHFDASLQAHDGGDESIPRLNISGFPQLEVDSQFLGYSLPLNSFNGSYTVNFGALAQSYLQEQGAKETITTMCRVWHRTATTESKKDAKAEGSKKKFRFTVPQQLPASGRVIVQVPGGRRVIVQVPPGSKPGAKLEFEIPNEIDPPQSTAAACTNSAGHRYFFHSQRLNRWHFTSEPPSETTSRWASSTRQSANLETPLGNALNFEYWTGNNDVWSNVNLCIEMSGSLSDGSSLLSDDVLESALQSAMVKLDDDRKYVALLQKFMDTSGLGRTEAEQRLVLHELDHDKALAALQKERADIKHYAQVSGFTQEESARRLAECDLDLKQAVSKLLDTRRYADMTGLTESAAEERIKSDFGGDVGSALQKLADIKAYAQESGLSEHEAASILDTEFNGNLSAARNKLAEIRQYATDNGVDEAQAKREMALDAKLQALGWTQASRRATIAAGWTFSAAKAAEDAGWKEGAVLAATQARYTDSAVMAMAKNAHGSWANESVVAVARAAFSEEIIMAIIAHALSAPQLRVLVDCSTAACSNKTLLRRIDALAIMVKHCSLPTCELVLQAGWGIATIQALCRKSRSQHEHQRWITTALDGGFTEAIVMAMATRDWTADQIAAEYKPDVCRRGHPLVFGTPEKRSGASCDECQSTLQSGDGFYCTACNYDRCKRCAATARSDVELRVHLGGAVSAQEEAQVRAATESKRLAEEAQVEEARALAAAATARARQLQETAMATRSISLAGFDGTYEKSASSVNPAGLVSVKNGRWGTRDTAQDYRINWNEQAERFETNGWFADTSSMPAVIKWTKGDGPNAGEQLVWIRLAETRARARARARAGAGAGLPDFMPADEFDGAKPGFSFKTGAQGTGYYRG